MGALLKAGGVTMSEDRSFANMMARLRTGDQDAAALVFDRYAKQLIHLAWRRLGPKLRQKVDPEDVLQSVFRSFFSHQAAGEITGLESWDNLWGLLVVITMRKCRRQIRKFHSATRDVAREIPAPDSDPDSDSGSGISSDEPTPEEAVTLTDTIEHLMSRMDPRQQEIFTLTLRGCTVTEISKQLGCTERLAFRVLKRVKEVLEDMLEQEA
jgi:RNA polymerase sigma factor (sigma-70 family)